MTPSEIQAGIAQLGPWFHKIQLPGGLFTKSASYAGEHPEHPLPTAQHVLPLLGPDLKGKRVLDIGCNGGFYSIEAQRRGASEVIGVDARTWHIRQARFAAATLGLERIQFQRASLYELCPQKWGTYDVVLALGLIYHLKYIYEGLEVLFAMTDDLIIIETAIATPDLQLPAHPVAYGYDRAPCHALGVIENKIDAPEPTANWFIPTPEATCAMLRTVGFTQVETIFTDNSRGIFTARKPKTPRTSTNPNGLKLQWKGFEENGIHGQPGQSLKLAIEAQNTGLNTWLGGSLPPDKGGVYLTGIIHQPDQPLFQQEIDWLPLTQDLAPGEAFAWELLFDLPASPGLYILELDLVANRVAHFQETGNPPLSINLEVTSSGLV